MCLVLYRSVAVKRVVTLVLFGYKSDIIVFLNIGKHAVFKAYRLIVRAVQYKELSAVCGCFRYSCVGCVACRLAVFHTLIQLYIGSEDIYPSAHHSRAFFKHHFACPVKSALYEYRLYIIKMIAMHSRYRISSPAVTEQIQRKRVCFGNKTERRIKILRRLRKPTQ